MVAGIDHGMIRPEGRSRRGPQMSATPDSTLASPELLIADLQRQLAQCRAERDEALQRETATAEVLQVINSSPGDLAPVFDAILEKAHSLCGISVGTLHLYDGNKVRIVARRGVTGRFAELLQEPYDPLPGHPASRLLSGERIVHIFDLRESAKQQPDNPRQQASAQQGLRTALWVPLRKDAELLGYISAFRQQVRPFSDKEITLLENFAAQAVIAMENARLLTETREALEQQTATAEVLQVINSSPGDLAPVFDAILEKAHTLCGAEYGAFLTYDGELFHRAAMHGSPPALSEPAGEGFRPGFGFGGLVNGEPVLHIRDMAEVAKQRPDDPVPRALVEKSGIRT
jgi:transcriptional regulator with GAF, ATPase, and Fis domain